MNPGLPVAAVSIKGTEQHNSAFVCLLLVCTAGVCENGRRATSVVAVSVGAVPVVSAGSAGGSVVSSQRPAASFPVSSSSPQYALCFAR